MVHFLVNVKALKQTANAELKKNKIVLIAFFHPPQISWAKWRNVKNEGSMFATTTTT